MRTCENFAYSRLFVAILKLALTLVICTRRSHKPQYIYIIIIIAIDMIYSRLKSSECVKLVAVLCLFVVVIPPYHNHKKRHNNIDTKQQQQQKKREAKIHYNATVIS